MNTGKPYERLIQEIYSDILRLEGVNNIEVRHDVSLPGRSGSMHQIDVFWEFELAGIRHKVVIQAKDWSSAVDQGEVLKFAAVLDDIPGQPRGIMVARSGFQSGARTIATSEGIVLYELRAPKDSDFEGRVKRIDIQLNTFVPEFRGFSFILDERYNKSNNINGTCGGRADQVFFLDEDGQPIESIHVAMQKLVTPAFSIFDWEPREVTFAAPTFVSVTGSDKPAKVLGIAAEVKVSFGSSTASITYADLYKNIFTSVTGDATYLISTDGRISQRK
jgi:hypothetical protein